MFGSNHARGSGETCSSGFLKAVVSKASKHYSNIRGSAAR